jgi:hypothetical protein
MIYVALGLLVGAFGLVQLIFPERVHLFFVSRNGGRSRWRQNPRGWSIGMVQYLGGMAVVASAILIWIGLSQ